ncbi:Protein PRY1 [Tetrabaena socialis]|uniref:Protein PRY1 n=1 Tax=Tetrabaena socialis TaxID=47790 RepID=A0A2J8AB60_9CHLO|nr:Protein PRY1 [Tetrabaena socialis]|eukprot:PNH09760.1 Protein PRY1 [Tetrabaena socialis]
MYRTRHQAPPLAWSTRLQKEAQDWADNCWFEHSQSPYGENLALGHPSIAAAIDGWYSESAKYNYSNPEFNADTGQFTQLVWVRSYLLGCAIGTCPDGVSYAGGQWLGKLYMCSYWLPGNYNGQFAANVLPPVGNVPGGRRRQAQQDGEL